MISRLSLMSELPVPNYPFILIMKAGPYCGYSLDKIINIKQEEEKSCGKFFWGYGGVFCRPHIVQTFVSYAKTKKSKVSVLFSETASSFKPLRQERFTQSSPDISHWSSLEEKVLLVGNKSVPHFAITASKLKRNDFELNLRDYYLFTPPTLFPGKAKHLDKYLRSRVDKACAIYSPVTEDKKRTIKISYTAELVEPFCVYIK